MLRVVEVPAREMGREPPFAIPILHEKVRLDAPAGEYEFLASFEHGAAAAGGCVRFFLSDPAALPVIGGEVTVWEDGSLLTNWLDSRAVACQEFRESAGTQPKLILVGQLHGAKDNAPMWSALVQWVARGSVAVFLDPLAFKRDDHPLGWLPLKSKGTYSRTGTWASARDDFAKAHPIFRGLPSGGLLDLTYYRDLIPEYSFDGQDTPDDLVAGALGVGYYSGLHRSGYYSGTHIAEYRLGAGSFIINTFLILGNLGSHPAADRLLLNMIAYGRRKCRGALVSTPMDLDTLLSTIAYR
jgi:hypothetical protein